MVTRFSLRTCLILHYHACVYCSTRAESETGQTIATCILAILYQFVTLNLFHGDNVKNKDTFNITIFGNLIEICIIAYFTRDVRENKVMTKTVFVP